MKTAPGVTMALVLVSSLVIWLLEHGVVAMIVVLSLWTVSALLLLSMLFTWLDGRPIVASERGLRVPRNLYGSPQYVAADEIERIHVEFVPGDGETSDTFLVGAFRTDGRWVPLFGSARLSGAEAVANRAAVALDRPVTHSVGARHLV